MSSNQPTKPSPKPKIDSKIGLALLVLLLVTFGAYMPSLQNKFVNWDDPDYVTQNDLVRQSWDKVGFKKIMTTPIAGNYHPLTILSLRADYQLGQKKAFQFHLTNLILHLLNTLLVFYFVYLLAQRKWLIAFITGLLFGVHPMHVESVAWVAERKDVLYTFFFLGGLVFYLKYLVQPKWSNYVILSVLFVLSLLSKPAAVVFPVVLLLIDFYKKRPVTAKIFLEKIPLFIAAFLMGLLTIQSQSVSAIGDFQDFSIIQRFMLSSYAFLMYLLKAFVPFKLSAFYPYPDAKQAFPVIFYISPVLVLLLFATATWAIKKSRLWIFSLLFYFVTIALVLQFVSVGGALMAERYTYVPYIGLFFLLGYGVNWIWEGNLSKGLKYGVVGLMAAFSIAMAVLSFQRCQVWENSLVLWTDVVNKYPDHYLGHITRGHYLYAATKDYDKALIDYKNGLAIRADYDAFLNQGVIFRRQGKRGKALESFQKAISMQPQKAEGYANRGNLYFDQKNWDKALSDYNKALEINPQNFRTYTNRGAVYASVRQYDKAIADYAKAIQYRPNYAAAYLNRALLHTEVNNHQKAVSDFTTYLQSKPNDAPVTSARGNAYQRLEQHQKAIEDFNKAIQIAPQTGDFYLNRSYSYNALGNRQQALKDAQKAQQLGRAVDGAYLQGLQ